MNKLIALFAILILTGCSSDLGGSIAIRSEIVNKELAETKILPLPGRCVSACLMQLLDPDVCVHPNAEFGFHAATLFGTDIIYPEATEVVMTYYVNYPKLLARLKRDHAMEKVELTWYSGRDLIKYGVKKCPFNIRAKSYDGA